MGSGCKKEAAVEEVAATTINPAKINAEGLREVTYVLPRSREGLGDTEYWVAVDMGYFAEQGLSVTLLEAYGTTDSRMVAAGNSEIACPAAGYIMAAIEAGLPVKAFAQKDMINIFGYGVPTDSPIKTIADLKGKKITVGDASWNLLSDPILKAAGLNPADVEYVVTGETRAQMVEQGQADAVFTWISEIYFWQGLGMDLRYIDGNEILPGTSNAFLTSLDIMKNEPELVRGYARATQKAMYFIYCNPEAALDMNLAAFPALVGTMTWEAGLKTMMGRLDMTFGITDKERELHLNPPLVMQEDKWKVQMQAAIDVGIIKGEIPLDKCFTNEFLWNKDEFPYEEVKADAAAYTNFKVKDQYK